jgi:hypothetical protein
MRAHFSLPSLLLEEDTDEGKAPINVKLKKFLFLTEPGVQGI